jgi:hypothetical protein
MATWDSTVETNLMKVKYGKLIDKQFNKSNILFARAKKKEDFVGSQIEFPVENAFSGGVSAGSLPTAGSANPRKCILTSKSVYATVAVDRQSMKAARTDEGSFVRFTVYPVKKATESFNRNLARMFYGDESGALAFGDGATNVSGAGSVGDPYVVTFAAATVMENIEINDILNYNAESSELLVQDVDLTAKTADLVGTSTGLAALSASGPVLISVAVYMQKSKDNEMQGLLGAVDAQSGTLYNIPISRRWKSYVKDAASAAISTDLMNDVVLNVKKQSGKSPKLIVTSYNQFIKFLNLLEDQKVYNLPARDKKFKASVSFSGIEFMSADGPIAVFPDRFCPDEKMYFLNDDHIEYHLRPGGFEWFDEDGTVFLRQASADAYDARYGGYGQLFINPHFQGLLDNLA